MQTLVEPMILFIYPTNNGLVSGNNFRLNQHPLPSPLLSRDHPSKHQFTCIVIIALHFARMRRSRYAVDWRNIQKQYRKTRIRVSIFYVVIDTPCILGGRTDPETNSCSNKARVYMNIFQSFRRRKRILRHCTFHAGPTPQWVARSTDVESRTF